MAARATSSSMIVSEVLNRDNYENWSIVVKNNLRSRNLWNVISGQSEEEGEDRISRNAEEEGEDRIMVLNCGCSCAAFSKIVDRCGHCDTKLRLQFAPQLQYYDQNCGCGPQFRTLDRIRRNAEALHAIQLSCGSDALSKIREITQAREAWSRLSALFSPEGDPDPEQGIGNLPLHRHVENGQWNAANYIIQKDDNAVFECNSSGKTALHVAVIAGQVEILKKLVSTQDGRLLRMQDKDGHTALSLVARLNGNTEMAECMVDENNDLLSIKTKDNEIPLLLAAAAGHKKMTRYLFSKTQEEEWTGKNSLRGLMLLKHCITSEIFDVALRVLQTQPLVPLTDQWDCLPSVFRARHRHPLNELAHMPSIFPSGFELNWWQRIIYEILIIPQDRRPKGWFGIKIISKSGQVDGQTRTASVLNRWQSIASYLGLKFFGRYLRGLQVNTQDFILFNFPGSAIKELYKKKFTHYTVLQILKCLRERVYSFNESQLCEASAYDAMLHAAKYGITELIESMSEANSDLLWAIDKNNRGIFSHAILNRQEKVFKLLVKKTILGRRKRLTSRKDAFGNNMLHLAAELGPSSYLNHRPGAALQMQREIQWFKEVEKIVHPNCKNKRNADGKKPHEVFTKSHEDLVKEGAKWARDTATSFTIVCTLIITIMFAAAFTVPGGTSPETGFPLFLKRNLFEIFALADAISLVASSASVLISIGILTSRYAEKDFHVAVPLKILFDLLFLFTSVVAMMVAFCAGIAMMLRGYRSLVIAAISLAGIPICAFVFTQLHLFIEIYVSTVGSKVFTCTFRFLYYALLAIFFGPYVMVIYMKKKLMDFCGFVSTVFTRVANVLTG